MVLVEGILKLIFEPQNNFKVLKYSKFQNIFEYGVEDFKTELKIEVKGN